MTAASHDVTVRGGRVSTERDTFEADIGIKDGVIVSIEKNLPPGHHDIDASGRWVLPGGIDSHVHIEQLSGMGMMCADDFYSGTVSAAFGGTTAPAAITHPSPTSVPASSFAPMPTSVSRPTRRPCSTAACPATTPASITCGTS